MIVDLTHVIKDEMPVFPGDDETSLVHTRTFNKHEYNNFQLSINMHCGTHIDGPMHQLPTRQYIGDISIDRMIGRACVIDAVGRDEITYEEKYEQLIQEEDIVVIHTGHSEHFGSSYYFNEYPVVSERFAHLLVRKKVKMLALDTPSPDRDPYIVHKLLLQNQILIAENLKNVDKIADWSEFEIIALPLAIQSDSAIARIIARQL